MKLSVEAKVAAGMATAFAALIVGVIAQENSRGQTGGPDGFGPTSNPAVEMYLSQQGYNSSLITHTNAEADEGN